MQAGRRFFITGLVAAALFAGEAPAEAKKRARRRRRGAAPAGLFDRGTTSGECPCNGGKVCVGPRGGRYCITRSGRKRYGV